MILFVSYTLRSLSCSPSSSSPLSLSLSLLQLSAASPYVVARLVADPSIAEPFLKFAKHFAESFLPLSGPRDTLTFFDFCQKALTTYAGAAQSTVSMQRRPPPLSSLSASTPSSPRGGGADGGAAATESFLFADVEECLELLQLLAVKGEFASRSVRLFSSFPLVVLLTLVFGSFLSRLVLFRRFYVVCASSSCVCVCGCLCLNADVVDFASPSEEEQASLPQVDCAGVVFFGLQTVLPLISAELLQVRWKHKEIYTHT